MATSKKPLIPPDLTDGHDLLGLLIIYTAAWLGIVLLTDTPIGWSMIAWWARVTLCVITVFMGCAPCYGSGK